ncbi:glycosyltransferase family 2 protein [Maribacter sp.]|uniref:glycosyltransferase family 2 protein n=1 Tax=Maribacter sp. TaxID=1897614 RepID=UPI0025C17E86|nr:glycosyltransferase family 2 protein [Maribacter sp.]
MKISLITGTYNSEEYIQDCVSSINEQDYTTIEHIIIDGASTDNTIHIINNTENRVTKIVSEPDNGIYDAMNKGIQLATGDVIGILNSDDFYTNSNVISTVISAFINNEVDCVYGNLFYVDQKNPSIIKRKWITGEYNLKKGFKNGWHPAHPAFFVKKEIYNKYGSFDTNFKIAADFELMLRFLDKHKISSHYIPEALVRMRLGGESNKSYQSNIDGNKECIKAFKKNDLSISKLYPIVRLLPKLKQYF